MSETKPEWWQNFFHGIALDLWRQAMTPEQTRSEADFIQKTLGLSIPAKILDAPCGNGRLSLELAQRGYRMTGVDIAPGFIDEGRANAAERRLAVAFECGDIRKLSFPSVFDGAFCYGNSFGYFDDAGNESFLEGVAAGLKPGAKFIIDTPMVAESFFPQFKEHRSYQIADIHFEVNNRYDHHRSRLETEYTFSRDGIVEKRLGSHRVHTYRELCCLLEKAGFTDLEGYGAPTLEPFELGSRMLLLVATKKVCV